MFSYKEFLVEKNQLNEGFWGWLKGMFKNLQEYAKKIKESGEIDKKINSWKTDLDKLIDEKVADIKQGEGQKPTQGEQKPAEGGQKPAQGGEQKPAEGAQTPAGQKPAGKENESYLYEAEEVKKEVLETMPDFIKTLGKEKSTGNAIDDAINQFLDNKKSELMPYINSDNKSVRLYVYAKIAELNTHILNKKIEIYKADKTKQKELKESQNKLKVLSEDIKKNEANLKKELENKTSEVETGKIYRYTNKKGQVSNVYLKKDGTAVTTSDKGEKEPGEPVDKPNIKDTFKPVTTKLKPQEDAERRKTMGDKLKKAGLDKIDPENV